MSHDRGPSLVLAKLWERTSRHGNQHFAGFWGGLSVALLRDGERPHPTRPDETVVVWSRLAPRASWKTARHHAGLSTGALGSPSSSRPPEPRACRAAPL
jgi:hypothetical protein